MESIAKSLAIALASTILLLGMYNGVRTTIEPLWFLRWRNRLNGDPGEYPMDWRNQWWAQWNMAMWDPQRPRILELRAFGVVVAGLSAVLLASLYIIAY